MHAQGLGEIRRPIDVRRDDGTSRQPREQAAQWFGREQLFDDPPHVRQAIEHRPVRHGQIALGRRMSAQEQGFGGTMDAYAPASAAPYIGGQSQDFIVQATRVQLKRQAHASTYQRGLVQI